MKKTIMFGLMLLLMIASVFAQGYATQAQQQKMNETRSTLFGLENAIVRVRQNETREHLEEVLSMIREKRAEQYQKLLALKNVIIERNQERNKIIIQGDGTAKLFGRFNWNYRYQYAANELTAEFVRDRKWYDFAFTELKE